jgi:hypothetical protein
VHALGKRALSDGVCDAQSEDCESATDGKHRVWVHPSTIGYLARIHTLDSILRVPGSYSDGRPGLPRERSSFGPVLTATSGPSAA